jgi:hypothetical protein
MNFSRQDSGIDDGTLEYRSAVEYAKLETAQRDAQVLRVRVSELARRMADSEARFRAMKDHVPAITQNFKYCKKKRHCARKRQPEITAIVPGKLWNLTRYCWKSIKVWDRWPQHDNKG